MSSLATRLENTAGQPQADVALVGLGAAEGLFVWATPDRLLASMTVLNPRHALRYALLATGGVLAGGALAFVLGAVFLAKLVVPAAVQAGYGPWLAALVTWFSTYDTFVLLAAGLAPFPVLPLGYAAGILHTNLLQFVLAVGAARLIRHGLQTWLIWRHGPRMVEWLHTNFFGLSMLLALGLLLVLMVGKLALKHFMLMGGT